MESLLYIKCLNVLQLIGVSTAMVAGIYYSIIVIIGLAYNKDSQNKYKDILLILAITHLVDTLLYALLLPILTFPTGLIYLFARFYPEWLTHIVVTMASLLHRIATELLAISMVYKVVYLMKPRWASSARIILYCATLPVPIVQIYFIDTFKVAVSATCDFICTDTTGTGPMKLYLRDLSEKPTISVILDYVTYLMVVFAGIPSILILNKWFKQSGFSVRTLLLQKRLTTAWGSMISLQSLFYLPQFVFWMCQFIPNSVGKYVTVTLTTLSVVVDYWVLPLRCIIIYMTLKKILRYPRWINKLLGRPTFTKTLVSTIQSSRTRD